MTDEEAQAQNDELMRAYRLCFGSPSGKLVMNDLMKFCKFRRPAGGDIEEGKRQAFLHIMDLVSLTDEQLLNLYRGQDIGEVN